MRPLPGTRTLSGSLIHSSGSWQSMCRRWPTHRGNRRARPTATGAWGFRVDHRAFEPIAGIAQQSLVVRMLKRFRQVNSALRQGASHATVGGMFPAVSAVLNSSTSSARIASPRRRVNAIRAATWRLRRSRAWTSCTEGEGSGVSGMVVSSFVSYRLLACDVFRYRLILLCPLSEPPASAGGEGVAVAAISSPRLRGRLAKRSSGHRRTILLLQGKSTSPPRRSAMRRVIGLVLLLLTVAVARTPRKSHRLRRGIMQRA